MKLPTTTITTASAAILAFVLSLPSSAATPEKQQQQRSYPARTIYQFANNNATTWIENIAVRPNGNLLLTLLDPAAELHEIAFTNNGTAEAHLTHHFAAYQGLLGIAETRPDAFALIAGNYTTNPPSWALWEVDFNTDAGANASASAAKVNELVPSVPGAKVLNGLTTVRQSSTSYSDAAVLLMSDSTAGTVLRVTLSSSSPPRIDVVLPADNRTTSPPPDDATKATGVNGVRYRRVDGHLYFANTYRELFCRVRVDSDGDVVGQVEVLAEGGFKGDDFALRWEEGEGSIVAYVMDGVDGEVVRVVVGSGEKEVVTLLEEEGGEAVGVKPTAAALGRRAGVDEDVLYVVTRDGKVLAVDLSS